MPPSLPAITLLCHMQAVAPQVLSDLITRTSSTTNQQDLCTTQGSMCPTNDTTGPGSVVSALLLFDQGATHKADRLRDSCPLLAVSSPVMLPRKARTG